jgi:5'-deoxynucleotidase YfbR-like HD superfamily hydrolase
MMTPDQVVRIGSMTFRMADVRHDVCGKRNVSATDHTVLMSLFCMSLAARLPGYEPGRVAEFVMVHDLPFAGVDEARAMPSGTSESDRHDRTLRDLGELLGDSSYLMHTLHAYEEQEEPEARLVRYVHRMMPAVYELLDKSVSDGDSFRIVTSHIGWLDRVDRDFPDLPMALHTQMSDLIVSLLSPDASPDAFRQENP